MGLLLLLGLLVAEGRAAPQAPRQDEGNIVLPGGLPST
jgi:hypothetical protein